MAQTKQAAKKKPAGKTNVKSNKQQVKPFFGEHAHIWAMGIFALAIFLFCHAMFSGNGVSIWDSSRAFVFGLHGFNAYLYPVAMVYLSVAMASEKADYRVLVRFFEIIFLLLFVSAAVHIFTADLSGDWKFKDMIMAEYYRFENYGTASGSGLFGAIIGAALLMMGKTRAPAVVIIILILFILLMHITGINIFKIYRLIGKSAKKTKEFAEEKAVAIAEERAKAQEEKLNNKQEKLPAVKDEPKAKDKKFRGKKHADAEETKKSRVIDIPLGPPADEEVTVDDDYISDLPVAAVNATVKRRGKKSAEAEEIPPDEDIPDIFEAAAQQENEDLPETKQADDVFTEFDDDMLDEIIAGAAEKSAKQAAEGAQAALSADEEKADEGEEFDAAEVNAAPVPVEYRLPPIYCLRPTDIKNRATQSKEELKGNADKLIDALKSFNVEAKILDIVPGPSVTRYEVAPAPGVKISKFTSLSDDLALHLAAPAGVRIEAPIPNKAAIGIEIPNRGRTAVPIREIIDSDVFRMSKSKLTVALGKDIAGNCVCTDLAKMPHLLIAGTTGSGKSVCLNTLIVSILYNATPSEVKLLLIDPKQVEFSVYNGIPHLLVPVVNEPRKAAGALAWAVTEMVNRYKILNNSGARDIKAYNEMCDTTPEYEKMPQVVIVIDELSDLMTVAPNEVEDSITRLAQMARAAGMHLVVATQRPSVDVITGLIKANIPSRIALSVSSQIDSRTIIDTAGAEKLLGLGDMLFCPVGNQKSLRVQGCYLSDSEINAVVKFVKSQAGGDYSEEILEEIERQAVQEKKSKGSSESENEGVSFRNDETLKRAIDFVITNPESCSISSLQRKLSLGFSKAGRYMDIMEEQGFVGPSEGSKPRKVLYTKAQWMEMQALAEDYDRKPVTAPTAPSSHAVQNTAVQPPFDTDEDDDFEEDGLIENDIDDYV